MRRSSESAIALVMTLIMLSVITVVAVAFLALTQRERIAVAQSTQQGDAEIMAEIAAERSKAEIFARYLAGNSNLNAVDLLVSRNYIRTNGFIVDDPVQPVNPDNVNYEYTTAGRRLSFDEMIQNLANLYYDPRVPVFLKTNDPQSPIALTDFRFYLDLNRNARFETNGLYPILDNNGDPVGTQQMEFVGDPEWIGVLEHPLFPHSRTNRFIGRYAYIVLPIGKSLDINFIHNQAKRLQSYRDIGFFRNQGVGPWELNLAAFLVDLNTNVWDPVNDFYLYRTNLPGQPGIPESEGVAFRDAWELYTTHLGAYGDIAPADQLFGAAAWNLAGNMIDDYCDGPLYVTGTPPTVDNDDPNPLLLRPWPGAFAPRGSSGAGRTNFFTPHDFFDVVRPRDPPPNDFRTRLHNTGFADSSYDRYTYYRMLAQLSTDSAHERLPADLAQLKQKISAVRPGDFVAEPAGKINLNYDNLDYPITDMVPWDTNRFFNAVADVLLRAHFPFGVSNIYITPTNFYGVAVHRLLQMAANIYDSVNQGSSSFPSVFRPFVTNDAAGRLLISGYYHDDNAANLTTWIPRSAGVPMIIGAKKGLPNFNEYVGESVIMATRKLEMRRENTNSAPYQTNEMFIIGISNFFGLEAWNSYTNAYTNVLDLSVGNNVTVTLTNSEGLRKVKQHVFSASRRINSWPGIRMFRENMHPNNQASFVVAFGTNAISINNGVYRYGSPPYIEDVGDTNHFTENSGFRVPDWHLTISNNLVFVLSSGNRIVDFVHLSYLTNAFGLATNFFNNTFSVQGEGLAARCWHTNRSGGPSAILEPTAGVQMQIDISLNHGMVPNTVWSEFANVADDVDAIRSFRQFVYPNEPNNTNQNLIQQVPFTPARKMVLSARWEVNDPLVHYMEEHLKDETNHYSSKVVSPFSKEVGTNQSLGQVNFRYRPWGGRPGSQTFQDHDMRVRDPGVRKSDDWAFPTNRFPSIGWLGRIHRGTPWQTIYLKSGIVSDADWQRYSLDPLSHPTNDWRLLDVFTTAIHPNASHGQLSINQTNFAAWSALLSGVAALRNTSTLDRSGTVNEKYEPVVIEAGSPELIRIYEAVQRAREQQPDKVFRRLGELMRVDELSVGSPFFNGNAPKFPQWGLNDAAAERLPQQILSLVKVGDPRYVIYAYGQSLRPAENSILTSGSFVGMCTNYQITGEFVTRTVFQIEGTAGQPRPVVKSFNILSAE
jgi:hypothetical protein